MKTKFSVVSASISLLFSAALYADQHPSYSEDEATLILPSINLDGKPGHFQEAELELVQDNLWQLRDVKEGKLNESINSVQLIQTDSFPVQVFLKISGEFPGCGNIGQTSYELDKQEFVVNAYYENDLWVTNPEIVLCIAMMRPFSYVYPLPVYGLPAGEYGYNLNGEFSGSFTLSKNNVYESSSPAQ